MKKLALLAVLALVPASYALAQSSIDDEINAELDRMYARSNGNQSPSIQVNVQTNGATATANPVQSSDQKNDQKTTQATETQVKNDAASAAKNDAKNDAKNEAAAKNDTKTAVSTVQKQPVTVIEASPLTESHIDQIRKARQDAEMKTEQSLAERLELSRIQDERRRAEVLFGDRFPVLLNQGSEKPVVQPVVQQQPVVVEQAPAPVVVAPTPTPVAAPVVVAPAPTPAPVVTPVVIEKPEVVEAVAPAAPAETKASLADLKAEQDKEEFEKQTYFGLLGGMGTYQNADNVRGNYALGFSIGSKMSDRLMVEGEFLMQNYDVEQADSGPYGYDPLYPRITEMNQYSLGALVKYQLMGGTFRPVVGGIVAYNYRTFSDKQLGFDNNDASSNALDAGLLVGLDFEISKKTSIGLNYRYMFNVYNRENTPGLQTRFAQSVYNSGTPIEKFNYDVISLSGRFSF